MKQARCRDPSLLQLTVYYFDAPYIRLMASALRAATNLTWPFKIEGFAFARCSQLRVPTIARHNPVLRVNLIVKPTIRSLASATTTTGNTIAARSQGESTSSSPSPTPPPAPASATRKTSVMDVVKIRRRGKRKITMVTAYDYPSAVHVCRAGIDILLVGDSVGMVELGYDTTQPVTVDEMLHHCQV